MQAKGVVAMIPVALQPEPEDFDQKVRRKGLNWLKDKGIPANGPPPRATDLPNYWTKSNKQLWDAYSGVCAYLAIYFEWVTGASSTDHFVPKSKHAGKAYEWDNYRLSCIGPNRKKWVSDDILDPIGLRKDTFVLEFATGKIKSNPELDGVLKAKAARTIRQLQLDSPEHNAMRSRRFHRYVKGKDAETLKELPPFIWYEAQRQGLL